MGTIRRRSGAADSKAETDRLAGESGAAAQGDGCENGLFQCGYGGVCAADLGEQKYFFWNGTSFEEKTTGTAYSQAEISITPVDAIPFEPKYMEELQMEGPRKVFYSKVSVTTSEGFVEIPNVGDVLQLYTEDNEMLADNYYYGKPWRVPAELLYGKECYLAVSELKDDFYKEY